jgi:outer membrane protein OmpA-like peptidoglycan-associated protein
MKGQREEVVGRTSKALRPWAWLVPAGLATLVLLGGVDCARKATSATPGGPASGSMHGTAKPPATKEPIRWEYADMPVPAPAAKPLYMLSEFNFPVGGVELDREAHGVMSQAVPFLNQKKTVELLLVGFTDAFDEKAEADSLALRRAETARKSMIGMGIQGQRLTVASFGSSQAKARADQPLAQALDRKVQLWVVKE